MVSLAKVKPIPDGQFELGMLYEQTAHQHSETARELYKAECRAERLKAQLEELETDLRRIESERYKI